MYLPQSKACNLPNSGTPISAAQIAAATAAMAPAQTVCYNGNVAMSDLVAALTPPVPTGSPDDFTTSLSISNLSPFPFPRPAFPGSGVSGSGGAARNGRSVLVNRSPSGADYPHNSVLDDLAALVPNCNLSPGAYPSTATSRAQGKQTGGAVVFTLALLALLGIAMSGDERGSR